MITDNVSESLTYLQEEPDIKTLRLAYDQTVVELEAYFDLCRTSYDDRRNFWPGKSRDHRKHGADAFPWEGASDMECHLIDERITRLVSLFMASLNRANVRAFPVESGDIARSRVVSGFLKWMVSSGYIPRFHREMELGANYLLERGILITYIGWQKEDRRILQQLDINQIAQVSPEVSVAIQDGKDDEQLVTLLQATFEGTTKKRAKKALRELRKNGVAELPIVRRQVNAPDVKTLAPDGDFFFPPYVTDPQRAPYCFWKTYYTPQELENKVVTDGWDEDFVDYIISKYRGVNIDSIEREQEGRRSLSLTDNAYEADELVEICYAYQRLIDQEDGAEGIYCTVFHKEFSGNAEVPGYAKFELLNGYEDYPVKQFLVDKFLSHTAEVIKMAYKCFQRFGPDEVFFRVTGVPDAQVFDKGNPDEDFDIMVNFDVQNNDPETVEKKLQQFVALNQLNSNNRLNVDSLLDVAAASIDPVMADAVLQPVENAQEEITKQVTDDLAKIFAGIEMPARQSGAQIALQVVQQYAQQPDIAQKLQTDQAFAARLQKYIGQYTFQMQQAQNAQIGRVGTAPAQMGEIDTQNI
jgi:hypothetical protein